jgi:hypothetical protein
LLIDFPMKIKYTFMIYVKLCMSAFFLFCFVDIVFARDLKEGGKESKDSIYKTGQDSLRVEQIDRSSVAYASSCVNLYENKTVASVVSVLGCDTLAVRNVTVTKSGNLTLIAPGYVTLNGLFETNLGGTLNIKVEPTRLIFEFFYDESGNRIMRQVNVVDSNL